MFKKIKLRKNAQLNNITNILNDFLEPFDCTAKVDTDFAYYVKTNTSGYALIVASKHEKTFMHFAETLFPEIKADPFLWSILHELGHHETEDDFEDEEYEAYNKRLKFPISDEEYYHLPIRCNAS